MAAAAPTITTLNQALSFMVYGESKAGKSLFAVSGKGPRLLLDVESAARFLPLRAKIWDPNTPIPAADPSWDTAVVQVKRWKDAITALEKLHSQPHPFNSVAVDSISELQYRYIESVGEQLKQADWGTALRIIRNFCNQLRDLTEHPKHPVSSVIVTSMAKMDDKGVWRPFLQGQMGGIIPYLFDVNAFLEKANVMVDGKWETQRRLHTAEAIPKTFIAGCRIDGRIPNPYVLPVVTGDTPADIGKRNNAVQRIIHSAFQASLTAMKAPPPPTAPEVPSTPQGATA